MNIQVGDSSTAKPAGGDYYNFGRPKIEKAIEIASEELKQEAVKQEAPQEKPPEPQPTVITIQQEDSGLRDLVEELKVVMRGINPDQSISVLQQELIGEIQKLGQLPAPVVNVEVPETKVNAPIKKITATNITRDSNGNIAGAEFLVERD